MFHVLIPVDDSIEHAESQAAFVAQLPCASEEIRVTLTHVIQESDELTAEMQQPERAEPVKAAVAHLENHDIEVQVRETHAPPEQGIIDLAETVDADHIILGGRKRSPVGKVVFGSVTQSVILNVEIPVTVTGSKFAD